MARTEITLTDSYQQVASAQCVITIKETPTYSRQISLNDTDSDVAALVDIVDADSPPFIQNEAKPTYAKGDGIVIIVDTQG